MRGGPSAAGDSMLVRGRLPIAFLFLSFCGCAASLFPLQKAAKEGQLETVKSLLDRGSDVNQNNLWTNDTALMEACRIGNPDIVKLLLDEHADFNARNLAGRTPLMLAAETGHADIAKLLLEKGAYVLTADKNGKTALMWATVSGDPETVRLLKKAQKTAKAESEREVTLGPSSEGAPTVPSAPSTKGETAKHEPTAPAIESDVDKAYFRLPEHPDDFALVIGIQNYSGIPEAEFAERDAAAVRENLLALGYPARNVLFLTGAQAGRASIEKYVESWLPRNVTENSRVFFYFSGHGAPDTKTGSAYLVPWDGDPKFLENTGYSIKRLYEKLNALSAKEVIVAMDACFSGAGGRSVLAKGARPLVNKVDTGAAKVGKLVVFSAAGPDEITGTDEAQGHGLFTYYFLKGLDGAAKDKRGVVTAKDLYDYLAPKVEDAARRQNRDQTPQILPADPGDRQSLILRDLK